MTDRLPGALSEKITVNTSKGRALIFAQKLRRTSNTGEFSKGTIGKNNLPLRIEHNRHVWNRIKKIFHKRKRCQHCILPVDYFRRCPFRRGKLCFHCHSSPLEI